MKFQISFDGSANHSTEMDAKGGEESSPGGESTQLSPITSPSDTSYLKEIEKEEKLASLLESIFKLRDGYLTWLRAYKCKSPNGQPEVFSEVEDALCDVLKVLCLLSFIPTHASSGKRPGACFSIRANRICQAIRKTIDVIKAPAGSDADIEELLHMIALQIGKLTLDGYGDSDQDAMRYYKESNDFGRILRSRVSPYGSLQRKDWVSHQIWDLMTRPTSFCNCRKCYRDKITFNVRRMPDWQFPIV